MNKIGEGYYYSVYELGNNKVLKKIKSNIHIFFYILISQRFSYKFFREYKKAIINISSIKSLYKLLLQKDIDLSLLGNPLIVDNAINYQQDRVTIIKEVILVSTLDESKKLIDDCIILIKKLWTYGFADEVYNFTINCGVDGNGNLVLIDFNEVTFKKERVIDDIKEQIWLKRWSYLNLPEPLKKYYQMKMEQELTVDELNKLWGSASEL